MIDGKKIRKLRKQRSYTLAELAQKANLSASYLSELERGNKQPSIKTIEKLATALNVHPSEIVHTREPSISVGDRIRLYRQEQDLTLTELATLTGLSYTYLCDIERGAALPSL
ncbi:MAG TPA: helix-turn-helix transcriptional regulator, partial [Firmicutes bacterium]|nr:helix-turn-helix transcriptional regulator [Bacillota bacterium]